ncbi:MAG: ABC-F family ATP-binding cassette domain-containing protein [Bacteroidales bacterium]|jgi:ATP-binding cassette subfamily F protein 3|nr:ABC-F family ATP-binding cassette domain-containing protein [Bacteroidales bacterium]
MISINNLSVQFSGESLFDHVSFFINDKDRIGLVGKNGAGKSTLLKIIKGIQKANEGDVIYQDGFTIGYLPQEMEPNSKKSVMEEAMTAFSEVVHLEERIAGYERQIGERTDYESESYHKLIRAHSDTLERYHLLGGQAIHVNIEKVLSGLGFEREEFTRKLTTFSSGWQMRVEIAKILLQQPNLVLLDEPTNHLDIDSIQWLEEFLTDYKGAVVLVSHDRAFLDNVTKRSIEISKGKIYDYKANYSEYVLMREERMESQLATHNNQQRQIRQIERFVERFRSKATKAKQVQSRIKMMEKIELVEVDLVDDSGIRFRFPPAPHSGKIILEAERLYKDYPQKRVLNDLNFSVIKNDRIAFVGKNGEGKTTLSKVITGQVDFTGILKFGHNVVIGYYAQDQSDYLDPEKTVFKTIDDIAVGDIRTRIKAILGGFLFSGDDIEKKVKILSGGEKSRLSLAKLLLTPANLLILDEPTNHLDMRSKDVLKNALLQFNGTLIIVSHDRDFLQGLTNRVFEFRHGTMKEYIGDIYDFLEQRRLRSLAELTENLKHTEMASGVEATSLNKLNWEKKKENDREIRKVKNSITKSESEIDRIETGIKEMEVRLGNPEKYQKQIQDGTLYKEYELLKEGLSREMKRWEELQYELEILES